MAVLFGVSKLVQEFCPKIRFETRARGVRAETPKILGWKQTKQFLTSPQQDLYSTLQHSWLLNFFLCSLLVWLSSFIFFNLKDFYISIFLAFSSVLFFQSFLNYIINILFMSSVLKIVFYKSLHEKRWRRELGAKCQE